MTASSPARPGSVADLMHAPVLTCGPEMPVPDVARMMADARVHALVVTGIENTPWAVVSARNLVPIDPAAGAGLTARQVAATEVATVPADAPLDEAARLLVEHEVDHLIVLDAPGHPAGILSTLDLVRRLAG
jgi:CBS domain-containing protein